jgi:hypothetical protein
MVSALTSEKAQKYDEEGDGASHGARSEVTSVFVLEIALSVVCSWKTGLAEPFYPCGKCVDSVVIDISMFIDGVFGDSMVHLSGDQDYGMGGFGVGIDHCLPPFSISIEKTDR